MQRHRRARPEAGSALVEFVVILPFFLGIVFALISFGAMFSFRQTLSQAATDGARAAVIAPANFTFAQRRDRAINAINEAFAGELGSDVSCGTGGLTCTIPTVPTSCGDASQCISVTATYAYATHPRVPVPQFLGLLPDTLEYTASARIK